MAINPSLLIVPYRYKAAKLYSQLPESGDGDFTVTRGTTATRVNASGLIESVASGVPRLDYTGGGCPSLLVEPAATNQIRNNTMVGAVTGTPGTTPTNWVFSLAGLASEVTSLGTENGVEFIDLRLSGTANSVNLSIYPESLTQISASSGQVYSASFFYKLIAQPNPPVAYNIGFREGTAAGAFVALGSTTVSPTTTLTRFTAARTLTGATTERVVPITLITLVSGSTYDFTIRIGLPQMELGSVATSVIKTSTTAITRNADVISLSSVSGLIGQTAGTIYAEVDFRTINIATSPANRVLAIFDTANPSTQRIVLIVLRTPSGLNQIQFAITNGTTQFVQTITNVQAGVHKLALAYQQNNFAACLDGQLFTSTSGNVPTLLNQINLGASESDTSNILNDRISAAAVYTSRLSDSQLIALTQL